MESRHASILVSGVVLAAGKSERMGLSKMSLPWGETTVLGQVVTVLLQSGLDDVLVVTGGGREESERALRDLPRTGQVRMVFNPRYATGEMLSSLQAGFAALDERASAALFALGDQPQIEEGVVRAVLRTYQETQAALVVPSYRMRRGHPMLLSHELWAELLALRPPQTLRDLLQAHAGQIVYVNVDTPSILQDLDTPEEYRKYRPDPP
jgi:molybdenum cofactor cytidylyltransferase